MPILRLTHEDIAFVVNCVPPAFTWPSNRDDDDFLGIIDREHGGGAALRLRMLAARRFAKANPEIAEFDVEVTAADLWALDTVMWQMDYTRTKMYGGTPVVRLAEKVWDALTTHHKDRIQAEFRGEETSVPVTDEQRSRLAVLDRMIDEF